MATRAARCCSRTTKPTGRVSTGRARSAANRTRKTRFTAMSINGEKDAIKAEKIGTKSALHYKYMVPAGEFDGAASAPDAGATSRRRCRRSITIVATAQGGGGRILRGDPSGPGDAGREACAAPGVRRAAVGQADLSLRCRHVAGGRQPAIIRRRNRARRSATRIGGI